MVRSHRKTIVLNAAQYTVEVLSSWGYLCVIVDEMAAFLHDVGPVPMGVHLVIVPLVQDLSVSVQEEEEMLIKYDPIRFRMRNSTLHYYEPTVSVPKRDYCPVMLIPVAGPPALEYSLANTVRLGELPVIDVLPLAVGMIKDISSKKPSKRLRRLLTDVPLRGLRALPDNYCLQALRVFEQVAQLSDQFSQLLLPFINFCREQCLLPARNGGLTTVSSKDDWMNTKEPLTQTHNTNKLEPHSPATKVVKSRSKLAHHKHVVVSNATCAVVDTLQSIEIMCVLVGSIACFQHGTGSTRGVVEVAVIPSVTGILSIDKVIAFLCIQDPNRFRVTEVKRKGQSTALSQFRYYEPTVLPPKKNYCQIDLIPVANPPPVQYSRLHTVWINDLPVLSILPLVIENIRRCLSAPAQQRGKHIRAIRPLLASCARSALDPVDEAFHSEAINLFEQLGDLDPQLKKAVSPLIKFCRAPSTSSVANDFEDLSGELASLEVEEEEDTDDGNSEEQNTSPGLGTIRNEVDDSEQEAAASSSSDQVPSSTGSPPTSRFSHPRRASTDYTRDEETRIQVTCLIAKRVVDIHYAIGVPCALFGSLASYLYGNRRAPNDIDILVFLPAQWVMDAESLKATILSFDPIHFSLETPRDPDATFRVLYFKVDSGLAPSRTFIKDRCKIDVLLPGVMHLPSLTPSMIKEQGALPVVPFSVQLLQKLQGWDDHRRMVDEPHKYQKHLVDAADVLELLRLEHVVPMRFAKPWLDRNLFSQEFMKLTLGRVKDFCDVHPTSREEWKRIGF